MNSGEKYQQPVVEVDGRLPRNAVSNRTVVGAVGCLPIYTIPSRHHDTMEVAIAVMVIEIAAATIATHPASANTALDLHHGDVIESAMGEMIET